MKTKILLIHGLNNNLECFHPLRDVLISLGFEVELLLLPNHGDDRHEAPSLAQALKIFEKTIRPHLDTPYSVVAFSQGALYFQLWLHEFRGPKPEAQVLLAPALAVRYSFILPHFFAKAPDNWFIKSQMPKLFRRYDRMHIWEYRLLMNGMTKFNTLGFPEGVKTLVMIDPKDELVNASKIEGLTADRGYKFVAIRRPGLAKGLGQHHIIFRPEYFSESQWAMFIKEIAAILTSSG